MTTTRQPRPALRRIIGVATGVAGLCVVATGAWGVGASGMLTSGAPTLAVPAVPSPDPSGTPDLTVAPTPQQTPWDAPTLDPGRDETGSGMLAPGDGLPPLEEPPAADIPAVQRPAATRAPVQKPAPTTKAPTAPKAPATKAPAAPKPAPTTKAPAPAPTKPAPAPKAPTSAKVSSKNCSIERVNGVQSAVIHVTVSDPNRSGYRLTVSVNGRGKTWNQTGSGEFAYSNPKQATITSCVASVS